MADDLKTLFQNLEPPPGGLAALRRRVLREPTRRRARIATFAFAGTAAAAALLTAVQTRTARRQFPLAADFRPAFVSLGLQPAPAEPAVIPPGMRHRMALQRVPLETDRVVFYYLAVLPETPSEEATVSEDSSHEAVDPEGRPD